METSGGAFFEQFIDDYFSECDQHLATVRHVVLDIEAGDPLADRQALFRALHTLKGLSGMVGLVPAEKVAHLMEEILRAADAGASAALTSLLFTGTALLEECIGARRSGTACPDIEPFFVATRRTLAENVKSDPGHQLVVSTTTAIAEPSRVLHRFTFTPSTELAARGTTVEQVRTRLANIGDIVSAVPRVVDGVLAFDFVVALRPDASPIDAWHTDGLDWDVLPLVSADDTDTGTTAAEQRPPSRATATSANAVRVDLARLDDIMRMVAEMVVSRARLEETLARVADGHANGDGLNALSEINDVMERQLRALREGVTRMRLVPVGEVFERLRFAARDVARDAGKSVRVDVSGQDTEIDKLVIDRILEPLLHLVRNALSHGIERPDDRRAAGKPAMGRVHLRARGAGDRIVIEVEDDGAGMNVAALEQRASLEDPAYGDADLRAGGLIDLICRPGFSTRDDADLTSGRGIGMSIVRTTVESLGGTLAVRTTPGAGTCFTMELPLTLMIADALLVHVGEHTMAIPQLVLREIVELESAALTVLENNELMTYRGRALPLIRLARLFNVGESRGAARHVLVVGTDAEPIGLVVDRVASVQEIVVHPLNDPLVAVPGISGATELADGRVSLILDAAALVRARQRAVA